MILTSPFNMMDNLIWPLFINTTPPPPFHCSTDFSMDMLTDYLRSLDKDSWNNDVPVTSLMNSSVQAPDWFLWEDSSPSCDVLTVWSARTGTPQGKKNTLKFWARKTPICFIKRGLVQETGWDYTFLLWTCLIISSDDCLEYSRFLWPM